MAALETSDAFDRGAFRTLTFEHCVRGFTLGAYQLERDARRTFAFDRIEDLAAWLVDQYSDQPTERQE